MAQPPAKDKDHSACAFCPPVGTPRIYLVGTMSVTAPNGTDLTPRSKKARALLALLALAPRGRRTRVWLRDKLWSGCDEKRSANSLRQTVFEIRRDLNGHADSILNIDRVTIGLKPGHVWVDVAAIKHMPQMLHDLGLSPDTELLEGIDIGDQEFEDWLQLERQVWRDLVQDIPAGPLSPMGRRALAFDLGVVPHARPTYSLGYLPSIQNGCTAETIHLADQMVESVANTLRELEPVTIYDFRDTTIHSDQLRDACETEFFVRARTLQIRDTLTLTFFLYRASGMRLEWSQSIQAPVSEVLDEHDMILSGFIAQNVDRLAKSLFTPPADSTFDTLPSSSFTALNMMFRLDDKALQNAGDVLTHASARAPDDPLLRGLAAYLLTFKVGENLGTFTEADVEDIRRIARNTLQDNPFNSLALACLGHVSGYVFGDHDTAHEIFDRALKLNPNQAFVWDHFALHNLYAGRPRDAMAAAQQAVRLGAYSPVRYSYETTLSMAATLSGELNHAVLAGKSALSKQPRYNAALRYLTAAYAMGGRQDEARATYEKLLQYDPDFADPEVRRARFRIADRDTERLLLSGLRNV